MTDTLVHDAIIIGGGPAGLQAALTLGRTHRDVVLLDSGTYRNDPTDAMHNVVGFDGATPAQFRAAARANLAAYDTVEVRDTKATDVRPVGTPDAPRFSVATPDGDVVARRLLLATGVRDELPPTPGLAELFGTVAAHCPYCHGHEFTGTTVGILGSGPHVVRVAGLMARIASHRVVLTDGVAPDPEVRATLDRNDVEVRDEPLLRLEPTVLPDGRHGARAVLDGGADGELVVELGGIMVAPTMTQSAPFAEQLGVRLSEAGFVAVDAMGRTSVPGVVAAGDLAHTADFPMPPSSVVNALAAGQMAAVSIDASLLGPAL